MTEKVLTRPNSSEGNKWLKSYYFTRAAVSVVWVVAAFTLATNMYVVAALLLIYPAWDAVANLTDALRNGGLTRNPTQTLNAVVSGTTVGAVAIALQQMSMHAVLGVFGVWAALAGLLQLATGVRRWKSYGAQWSMILSGAQSVVAGVMFLKQANAAEVTNIRVLGPYVAFGAVYFVIAGLWLDVSDVRRRRARSLEPTD